MNILALDLGTKTGWCAGKREHHISGVWNLMPGRFDSQSMRLVKLLASLDEIHQAFAVKRAYYEEVRRHSGVDAAHWYGAFWSHVIKWCDENEIPYEGVPVGQIKKHATGKGNAKKEAMLDWAFAAGYSPIDDNEADALALFDMKAEPAVPVLKEAA